MFRRFLMCILAASALSACSTGSTSQSFVQELDKQYQSLSTAENEPFYDWTDAAYYRDKGQRALDGKVVLPEDPETWKTPAEYRPEMNKGYDILQIAFALDNKKVTHPIPAAQAQAYFDCWVEQSQEKWTPETYQQCRAKFYDAVCRMYEGDCSAIDNIYRVHFSTDSSTIDTEGRKAVASAIAAYKKRSSKEVIVAGHADRVGNADYNLALSNRRAEAVKDALQQGGVSSARVDKKYFGEAQPLIPTADNVPNRNNRRVLIVVR